MDGTYKEPRKYQTEKFLPDIVVIRIKAIVSLGDYSLSLLLLLSTAVVVEAITW